MRVSVFVFAAAIAVSGMMPRAASAHPGPNLLITDSKTAPRAMSGNVSFEEINGVHLFKGSPAREDAELLGGETASSDKRVVEIEIRDHHWRRLRKLRTQGFYSGVPYPSRRRVTPRPAPRASRHR